MPEAEAEYEDGKGSLQHGLENAILCLVLAESA